MHGAGHDQDSRGLGSGECCGGERLRRARFLGKMQSACPVAAGARPEGRAVEPDVRLGFCLERWLSG